MEKLLVNTGRKFYGICVAACGIQQLFYADFNPVFLPASSTWLPGNAFLSYVMSAVLILAGMAIMLEKKARTAALVLGGLFLAMFLFCQVPHLIFVNPNGNTLGVWTRALKELAFSGGAFCVAGSFPKENSGTRENSVLRLLERIVPFGRVFFSITMIAFGIDHFLYAEFVATLVPSWIPGHLFWTYFAGVALIGSGVAIILSIQLRLVALLLGTMIFLWFIFLHIPRAIADPFGENGNELTSVFQSLGFSGVAFVIAYGVRQKKSVS